MVLADETQARFYEVAGENIRRLEPLDNPKAHRAVRDLESDRPGRRVDSFGHRHALGGEEDAKRHATAVFAREIADRLAAARVSGHLGALTLVMSSRMLGLLRDALDAESSELVRKVVRKNLMHLDEGELRAGLAEALRDPR
jgi:protein required for attachment to host cells